MSHAARPAALIAGALFCCLVVFAAGCNKGGSSSESAPSGPAATTNSAPSSGGAGQTASTGSAYDQAGCSRCHGSMTAGGGRAPNLSKEGGQHDAAWIADQIKNPRSHNPGSRMPAYQGRLTDAQIKEIADALAAQK